MRFNWIQDRYSQRKLNKICRSGATNLGVYHTKHNSSDHHQLIRHKYLHTENLTDKLKVCLLQGCVISLVGAHPRTPRNSPVQEIPRYARITVH